MSAAKIPMLQRLFVGGTVTAVGAFIIGVGAGVVPTSPEKIHAPMWIIAMAGLVFVLAGVMMLAGWLEKEGASPVGAPAPANPIASLFVVIIMLCLAVPATWATFAEGDIEFGISLPFVAYDSTGNELIGRILFGLGAALCWIIFVTAALHAWRRLFGEPKIGGWPISSSSPVSPRVRKR